jgi:hypothetical protein
MASLAASSLAAAQHSAQLANEHAGELAAALTPLELALREIALGASPTPSHAAARVRLMTTLQARDAWPKAQILPACLPACLPPS